ncbi:MAG: hypothetical protein M3O30_12980 [Planctomycetota bacterium]|nr:hypothetical protein [Planctomycetota bacterium]
METLETRMMLTISATGATALPSAVEGQSTNVGYLDAVNNGPIQINQNQAWTVDHVRTPANTLTVNGTLNISPAPGAFDASHLSVVHDLVLGTGATLDLANNVMIIRPGINASDGEVQAEFQKISGYVASGANSPAGGGTPTWTGSGIVSSTAQSDSSHLGVGVILNRDDLNNVIWQTFAGLTLNTKDIIVAFTRRGDAILHLGNNNQAVDFSDFVILSNHFGQTGTTWQQGNFNYDGQTDFADFVILSNNFGQQVVRSDLADTSFPPKYLANFTDDSGAAIGAFTAIINWNDMSQSQGMIVPDGQGGYNVLANHTYLTPGLNSVGVQINNTSNATSATVNDAFTITDAPITASAVPISTSNAGTTVNNAVLATFNDANQYATLSDFTTLVNWGDDSGNQTASVQVNPQGGFEVIGSHNYSTSATYLVTVGLNDQDGSSSATAHSTVNPGPAPVITTWTVTRPLHNSIALVWTAPTLAAGIDHYEIDRQSGGQSAPSFYATVTGNTYTDTNILLDLSYSYTVQAFSADGTSSKISATRTVFSYPAVPTDVHAVFVPNAGIVPDGGIKPRGAIVLTWDPRGDSSSDSFQILRSDSSGTESLLDSVAGRTYTDDGSIAPLANGTTYYYTVATWWRGHTSPSSFEVSATYYDPTLQVNDGVVFASAPASLTTNYSNNSSATVTFNWQWQDSSNLFNIEQSPDGVNNWTPVPWLSNSAPTAATFQSTDGTVSATNNGQTNTETLTASGLTQANYYRVQAVSNTGNASSWSNASLPPYGVPFQFNANIQNGTNPSVQLNWADDPSAMFYRIFRRNAGTTSWGTPVGLVVGTASSWLDPSTDTGTTYDYFIYKYISDSIGQVYPTGGGVYGVTPVNLSVSNLSTTESGFAGTVGTFSINPALSTAGYTATINWGDGGASTVTPTTDGNGNYTIAGTHAYSAGSVPFSVTITEASNVNAVANATAIISDAPLSIAAASPSQASLTVNKAYSNLIVADFTDPDPNADASLYTATIASAGGQGGWSNIQIVPDGSGGFYVEGNATFTALGSFNTTVSITDNYGGSVLAPNTTFNVFAAAAPNISLTARGVTPHFRHAA